MYEKNEIKTAKTACIGVWPRMHFLYLQHWYVFWTAGIRTVVNHIKTKQRYQQKLLALLCNKCWPRSLYDITGTLVASETNMLWRPTPKEAVTLCQPWWTLHSLNNLN